MFEARVAVLIEKDGILYAYMSHKDFPESLPGRLEVHNKTTPEDYVTVAQQNLNSASSKSTLGLDTSSTQGPAEETLATLQQTQQRSPGIGIDQAKRIKPRIVSYFDSSVSANRE